jgi:hypothetical protein
MKEVILVLLSKMDLVSWQEQKPQSSRGVDEPSCHCCHLESKRQTTV